jgi:diguanylate cyclase (GGDEF)-like protein
MAVRKTSSRTLALACTATTIVYFGALLVLTLGSSRVASPSIRAALIALIILGLPAAWGLGVLIWRAGQRAADDLAYRDELTGLPNRRAFIDDADGQLREAQAGRIALVLADVDLLKSLNDGCGHQAGDELLEFAACQLTRAASTRGRIYRIGGDEFAIVVDRAAGSQLSPILRSLGPVDRRFRSCGHEHTISMSIGFASNIDGESFESMFKRADRLLYRHKASNARVWPFVPTAASAGGRVNYATAAQPHLALVHSRDWPARTPDWSWPLSPDSSEAWGRDGRLATATSEAALGSPPTSSSSASGTKA